MPTSGWKLELGRFAGVLLLALFAGWMLGASMQVLAFVAFVILAYWSLQLWRVSYWLRNTEAEPPEASGIWGELWDSIYHLQRRGREEKNRLQTEVSYLRESFAALREAAVMIDPQGRIEWSNAAAERFLGLQHPRDRGQALLNLLRIPRFHQYVSGQDFSEPLLLEGPLDAETHLLIEITPFGRGSLLMLGRDVTREERLEEMRREFVANVSHELRTPLTVITGYLHTLIDNGLGEDKSLGRPLLQMQEQSQRMETLLKDLLWLSQLESLAEQVEHQPLRMGELLAEISQQFGGANPERVITVELMTDETLQGDYRQIYSAVSNLVMNALKYSEAEILLRWSRRANELVLSVTDQGPGIDAVHLPRLTERFYRVDKSRSVETGGTGLGLAIVKHVLAAHNARLEIESVPGQGSTFRCHFPVS
jgi:two-component system, OmpR family, phosphate regulon sensor histidine kinase PhoR